MVSDHTLTSTRNYGPPRRVRRGTSEGGAGRRWNDPRGAARRPRSTGRTAWTRPSSQGGDGPPTARRDYVWVGVGGEASTRGQMRFM